MKFSALVVLALALTASAANSQVTKPEPTTAASAQQLAKGTAVIWHRHTPEGTQDVPAKIDHYTAKRVTIVCDADPLQTHHSVSPNSITAR